MNSPLAILGCLLLASASDALAQSSTPEQRPERPAASGAPLNLKLEEPTRGAPRITFEPRQGASDKGAASNLPALGGGSVSFERPPQSSSQSSSGSTPFPKDTAPAGR
jgi:hypothetical protein